MEALSHPVLAEVGSINCMIFMEKVNVLNFFEYFAHFYCFKLLSSEQLLSKNLKIKMYKTIILPGVLYGCKTRSLTLR